MYFFLIVKRLILIKISTFYSQSKTKIAESITESCHSESTVTTASNLFGQESSVCGNQPKTKRAHTSHLRTVMNPASFHGLELDECTNQKQTLTDRFDKIHSGRVYKIGNSLPKLLILSKGMTHF